MIEANQAQPLTQRINAEIFELDRESQQKIDRAAVNATFSTIGIGGAITWAINGGSIPLEVLGFTGGAAFAVEGTVQAARAYSARRVASALRSVLSQPELATAGEERQIYNWGEDMIYDWAAEGDHPVR